MLGLKFQVLCLFVFAIITNVATGRKDFACSSDEFECTKSQTCTRLSWKCDGEEDCFDGEDETDCPPITCRPGYFKCGNGRCIEDSWVCDRHSDCPGKDDEAPIQKCNKTSCRPSDFQCRNGDCIQGTYRCDREHDCGDKSDEDGCPELVCDSTEFKCANNLTCISSDKKCDGVEDCADRSDENNCPLKCNATSQFTCGNGECFPLSFHCDGDNDCLDSSDEKGCPQPPTFVPCPDHKFQCSDGECIPLTWHCDGSPDCTDRTDEVDCPATCMSTQFTCVQSGKCISQHSKCDNIQDCLDGSDEADCGPPTSCDDANSYRCGSSKYCINPTKVCNGLRDCPRGEDEAPNCGINECSDHNGHCIHSCRDLPIGYECHCNQGYKLANDSRSCDDLNECEEVYGSCSQNCVNFKGSFKCSCVQGYRLESDDTVETCRATGPQAYLVFGGEHAVHNLTLSGTHYGDVVSNLKAPIAIGHDLSGGYVFWSDIIDGTIERAQLLGDGTAQTVVKNVVHSNGVAIDWIGKKIYWTDETLKSIEVSELNGQNRLKLFSVSLEAPRGLALDPFTRDIFWTDWGGVHPRIETASMDGNSNSRKVVLDTDIVWPTALTIDNIAQRLFFADTKSQRIDTIKYDGSARKTLIFKGLAHPLGLAVFEDRLYYTDYSLNTIFTVNKRTGQRLGELKSNLKRPTGVNVVHPLQQKQVPTQCTKSNGGCSHLCLLSSASTKNYTCRCPNGMVLGNDNKSCASTTEQNSTTPQPVHTTKMPSVAPTSKHHENTSPSATTKPGKTNKDGTLAKKQEGSSSNNGPMIAGVTVTVLVLLFLLVVAFLYWRRRSKMADRSILFYKDNSTTPLQNDFDEDLIKSHEDIGGMSRVQFT